MGSSNHLRLLGAVLHVGYMKSFVGSTFYDVALLSTRNSTDSDGPLIFKRFLMVDLYLLTAKLYACCSPAKS